MSMMGLNVTDATCEYGLAQTATGCNHTLASLDTSEYLNFQIGYCIVGVVTMVISAIMYYRADKYDGSPLQLYSFLLCCYASLTVMIRGADPASYGHIVPRPINALLADTCTAALFSVYIFALGYWATVIQQGAAVIDKPTHLKCLEYSTIIFVWVFYIAYDMSLFAFKGFIPLPLNYLQLGGSIVVLALISLTFLIYGLRVLARLYQYERQLMLRPPSTNSYRGSNQSFTLSMNGSEDWTPVVEVPRYAARRPKQGHTTKIVKILLVAETMSIGVLAVQIYRIMEVSSTPVELSCANGRLCDTIKSKWSILHICQVVCVWAVLWVFRGVQKKDAIKYPEGSTEY
ncbi:hypothetical protein BBJ29_001657 [Phytophthora kernoviae]|uniref:THH1/TOM1/TOM3 domain-containing protein n=1 Tax=Phytophthora kernoviae TaxID=325452 RepID=A0A3F2RRW5_9STRA|nr:hypothetical protein BBP00_00004400 [Phytophthora kernoviae]RLN71110.1 hypothetical protein BBJ29_001657 [Phytophthora kernoviae]